MDTVVVNNVPFEIDGAEIIKKLHIKASSSHVDDIHNMVAQALQVAKPKAVYKPAYIEEKGDNFIVVDGIKFTSRVLRVNVEEAYRVFPYVITCGTELDDWSHKFIDLFDSFCAETIKETVLISARQKLMVQIDEEFGLGHTANMNPGSLEDWPITEQKPLFELLGTVQELIGVELTESFLMTPIKSVSGIHFPKEVAFVSCQLCPREQCPGRKALYDKDLFEQYKLK